MRLKRTRLGKDDFEPLVVIGRGAFGEVQYFSGIRPPETVILVKMGWFWHIPTFGEIFSDFMTDLILF